jgi:hypothetical protein
MIDCVSGGIQRQLEASPEGSGDKEGEGGGRNDKTDMIINTVCHQYHPFFFPCQVLERFDSLIAPVSACAQNYMFCNCLRL